jgi:hypothetical protein
MRLLRGAEALGCMRFEGHRIALLCPECGGDRVSESHVGSLLGSDGEPIEGADVSGSTPERRSAVEAVYYCDLCGCRFALVLQHLGRSVCFEVHVLREG